MSKLNRNASSKYNGKTIADGSSDAKTGMVKSVFVNEELEEDLSPDTMLVNVKDRDGNSLGIKLGDKIKCSIMKGCDIISKEGTVDEFSGFNDFIASWDLNPYIVTLNEGRDGGDSYAGTDQFGNKIYSKDNKSAVFYTSQSDKFEDRVSGIHFSVSSEDGTPNELANRKLNALREVIFSADASEDNAMDVSSDASHQFKVGFQDLRAQAFGLSKDDGSSIKISDISKKVLYKELLNDVVKNAIDRCDMLLGHMDKVCEEYYQS